MAPNTRGGDRTGKESAWVRKGKSEGNQPAAGEEDSASPPRGGRGRGRGRDGGRDGAADASENQKGAGRSEGSKGKGKREGGRGRGRGGNAANSAAAHGEDAPAAEEKVGGPIESSDEEDEQENEGAQLLNMIKGNAKVIRYTKEFLLGLARSPASRLKPEGLDPVIDASNRDSVLLVRMGNAGRGPVGADHKPAKDDEEGDEKAKTKQPRESERPSAERSSAEPSTTAAAPPVAENKASALAPASKSPGFTEEDVRGSKLLGGAWKQQPAATTPAAPSAGSLGAAAAAAAATRPPGSTTASLAASLAGAPSTGPASTAAMQAALAAAGSGGHDPFMQYAAATQMRQMQQYQQMQYQMAIAQQAASRGAYGGSGFPGYDAAAAAAGWPFGAYPPYGGYGLDNAAAMAEQRQKMQAAMAAKAAAPPAKAKAATKANAQAKAKQQAKSAAAKPMQAKIMERSVPPGVVQQTAAPSKKNTTSPALAPQASPDFSLPSHPSVPAASTSDEKFLIPSAGAKGDDDEDDAGCAQS